MSGRLHVRSDASSRTAHGASLRGSAATVVGCCSCYAAEKAACCSLSLLTAIDIGI